MQIQEGLSGMKWIKRGVIYTNPQRAQMPTALVMPDRIRIYYNIRDEKLRARCHFIDVDKDNPKKVIGESKKEVLPLGELGAFDDAGVMPSAVRQDRNGIELFYVGFSLAKDVPYKFAIGQAISKDGKTFKEKALCQFSNDGIYGTTTPTLLNGVPIIAAYGYGWIKSKDKLEPIYRICYHTEQPIIKPKHKYEVTCRPAIVWAKNKYHMWFSYRDSFDFRGGKGSYRMGYATSDNGIKWKRDDSKAGITVGKKGEFDSDMVCYPNIVRIDDRLHMFYNGSGFGATGIGWATCDL